MLGTVFLYVDYGMPLEPLRAELRRICEAAPEWDGRFCLIRSPTPPSAPCSCACW